MNFYQRTLLELMQVQSVLVPIRVKMVTVSALCGVFRLETLYHLGIIIVIAIEIFFRIYSEYTWTLLARTRHRPVVVTIFLIASLRLFRGI